MSLYRCKQIMVTSDGWLDKLPDYQNPTYNKDTLAELFSKNTYRILEECLGEGLFKGQRFRITSAHTDSKYSVAGCMSDYLSEAFRRLDLPFCCSMITLREAKEHKLNKRYTVKLFSEDAPKVKPEYVTFVTEPCEVPKKIASSPTTGEKIVRIDMGKNLPITAFVPLRKTYHRYMKEQFTTDVKNYLYEINSSENCTDDYLAANALKSLSHQYECGFNWLLKYKDIPEIFCGEFIWVEDDVWGNTLAEIIKLGVEGDDIYILYDIGNWLGRVLLSEYELKWTPDSPALRERMKKELEEEHER